MAVIFSYADKRLNYPKKTLLKQYLVLLAKEEGRFIQSLNYVFCSDEYLLRINQQFLQHDYFTDIITFDLSEPNDEGLVGEIYVSVDRMIDNAKQLKVPVQTEIERVIFHGLLHLCGYSDKGKAAQKRMREAEDRHIARFSQFG